MDYPRLVYRLTEDPNAMPVSGLGLVACLGVDDAKAHAAALADGWVDSVPDLAAADDAAPTREELTAQADKLGIAYDKRWGNARLLAAIEVAMA